VDSGINPRDFQVGHIEGGIGIRFRDNGIVREADWEDRLGHGTAVAATIRAHAPAARLYAIRVFHRLLEAHFEAILEALEWGVQAQCDLLNLSLGSGVEREDDFAIACARAAAKGVTIVSTSRASGGPASFLAVAADYALEGEDLRIESGVVHASPWARERGTLPRERNFHGTSFAVARVTGIAARLLSEGAGGSLQDALGRVARR
jgi:hypothetical protein